jgi:hypothetical protein
VVSVDERGELSGFNSSPSNPGSVLLLEDLDELEILDELDEVES